MVRARALLLGLLLLLPAALAMAPPALATDPWAPGPYAPVQQEYDFGDILVTNPTTLVTYPVRLHGSVTYPAAGAGPFPLVLFMHGRHGTCEAAGIETLGTCPKTVITTPIDSYRGYDYVGNHLVTRGYVVVSVDVNQINDADLAPNYGMQERAQVVVRTLDEFTELNAAPGPAPVGAALVGRIDLQKIGLMGHSRGGEGVTKAISWNAQRTDGPVHAIKAVFALAPIDALSQKPRDVEWMTLLPYCDGDVYDLEGGWMYDDARYLPDDLGSKRQVLVMGANHNYYNTIWTADDNGGSSDPYCGRNGSGRLSPEDQRRGGLVLVEAFFREVLGGETTLRGITTGESPIPAAGCPIAQPTCPGRHHVSYHAPTAQRRVVEDTRDANALTQNDLGGAVTRAGFSVASVCAPSRCPTQPNYQRATQLTLGWNGPATYATAIPAAAGDVTSFGAFVVRVGLDYSDARNPAGQPQDFRVVLTDAGGASASATVSDHSLAAFPPPGSGDRKVTLNQARVPLSAFAGVDLSNVRSVELVFDRTPSGMVQLTDLMFE